MFPELLVNLHWRRDMPLLYVRNLSIWMFAFITYCFQSWNMATLHGRELKFKLSDKNKLDIVKFIYMIYINANACVRM